MLITITKKTLLRFGLIILSIFIVSTMLYIIYNNYASVKADSNTRGYIVLIIDDFGNHSDGTEEMLDLNIPITAAVMPFMPYSQTEAKAAHDASLEVILHLAMEPNYGKKEWLGPRGVTCDLEDDAVKCIVYDGLDEVKFAVGINNHMGSKATQDKRIMKAIMEIAKEKNLFFVDSKTSPKSVVSEMAKEYDVHCFTRDVFLDGTKDTYHIKKQLMKLSDIALKRGYAIGIGHVGIEGGRSTAEAIKAVHPFLTEKGIRFITIRQLIEVLNK